MQTRAILIALLGFLFGFASCSSPGVANDHSFAELVRIEPEHGSIVTNDTVLVATLEYRIDRPEQGLTYYFQPAFATIRPTHLGEPIFDLHAEGANVPLRKSEGQITATFRLSNIYSNRLLRHPVQVRYYLLAGRGIGLADRIVGVTRTISYRN